MSTPSVTTLESDLVSPYAPKWAQEQALQEQAIQERALHEQALAANAATSTGTDEDTETDRKDVSTHDTDAPPRAPLPKGIETEHDAKILDEIEVSLREMLAAANNLVPELGPEFDDPLQQPEQEQEPQDLPEPEAPRLADVTTLVADRIARHEAQMQSLRQTYPLADLVKEPLREDEAVPPWLLPRSLEPQTVPEPWPRPRARKRNRALPLLMRFGIASAGAAVLATVIVQGIPGMLYDSLRTSFATLSSNAASVFNEGKATALQSRMDTVSKQDQPKVVTPVRVATAAVGPAFAPRSAAPADEVSKPQAAARQETTAVSWPTPGTDAPQRSQQPIWHGPPDRAQASEAATSEPATPRRQLTAEEIEMLRKQGDDYIANGDFAGARVVLERAADAGDASAALALAATYDPAVLARFKVRGLEPDVAKAGFWYERARALGSTEAPARLQTLARGN